MLAQLAVLKNSTVHPAKKNCKMPRDWDASEDTENDVPAHVIEAVDEEVKACQSTRPVVFFG